MAGMPGRSMRLVLGSLVALVLVLGVLLVLDSKKVESPGVAEQPKSTDPAGSTPRAPNEPVPRTTDSPK